MGAEHRAPRLADFLGVFVLGPGFRIVSLGPTAAQVLGLPAAGAMGRRCLDMVTGPLAQVSTVRTRSQIVVDEERAQRTERQQDAARSAPATRWSRCSRRQPADWTTCLTASASSRKSPTAP